MKSAQVSILYPVTAYFALLCLMSTAALNNNNTPSADTLEKLFNEEFCDNGNYTSWNDRLTAVFQVFHEGYGIHQRPFKDFIVMQDPPKNFTPNLGDCASKSDIVYCVRIFLEVYNVTACVNLTGTVEETPTAKVLGIVDNLQVIEAGGKAILQILSPTAFYRSALVTGLVKKPGCNHLAHAYIRFSPDTREIDELVSFPASNLTVIEGQSVRVLCSWASSQISKYVQWSHDNKEIGFILENPYCEEEEEDCTVDPRLALNDTFRTADTRSYLWQDKNCARREVVTHTELWINNVSLEDMGRYTCTHFSIANNDERDEKSFWITVVYPECTFRYCIRKRNALCTKIDADGDCSSKVTSCKASYYSRDERPAPGKCSRRNRCGGLTGERLKNCLRKWAKCVKKAFKAQHGETPADLRKKDFFKTLEYPCGG